MKSGKLMGISAMYNFRLDLDMVNSYFRDRHSWN